jgi:YVTN family beta-propeller protein
MVLRVVPAPDGRAVIALHSGFNPHGLVVVDTRSQEAVQRIPLKTAWYGMAWSPDGKTLYVSGGNAAGRRTAEHAPIYEFTYSQGRLSTQPSGRLDEPMDGRQVHWAGLAYHPKKHLLYAANRGTGNARTDVVVFNTDTREIVARIRAEVNPHDLVFGADARTLFVSNWASKSVSVIDTETNKVTGTIVVGANPNDMELAPDGRLFVACSNDNTVHVIDTKTRQVIERISTTLYPLAPEGSTPDALAIDPGRKLLYVANADNNAIAVVQIRQARRSEVIGFIPSGWYPSALALTERGRRLYIGTGKGENSYSDIYGPGSPLPPGPEGRGNVKSLLKGSVEVLGVADLQQRLPEYTRQVMANSPYNDSLLVLARPKPAPSVIPEAVGERSPIEHVIYVIKENRTYDQVFGDLPRANGDPRLTIFGRNVTPNQHALAEQFVILDNLYCDGEVSFNGHSWSNAAYSTDFNERYWTITYGGHSQGDLSGAYVPSAGYLWDLARRKGLTYRSYGEWAEGSDDGDTKLAPGASDSLLGHMAPNFHMKNGRRDTENMSAFLSEFEEYERNIDNLDPEKRLPNFIVMSLQEDHTNGTRPGAFTPIAMVANNDQAVGMLVDRVSHSRYWPSTAIFIIEDDAQDGPDHVDARRTVGLVIGSYVKRGIVDSTFYSTSSMLRTMELLLGLPPMSQFDAAATPMYASFGVDPDLRPFTRLRAEVDVNAKNATRAYGARESMAMDFSGVDKAPMHLLNTIIWKSVKGASSPMPAPVHRFRPILDAH